ncbi:MAG: hypothetical protein ACC682_00325 [Gemmatimonadota bacterium]
MARLALVATTAVACAACSPPDGSRPATTVSDSAGVTLVENRGAAWAAGAAWSIDPAPTVSIGVLDGAAEYQLFGVVAAARQSDGTIVLVDESRMIRRYASDGSFIGEFGGEGAGPGEFRGPAHLLIGPGDSIDVGDVTLSRVTRFGPAGEFAGMRALDLAALGKAIRPPLYPAAARPLPDGRMLVRLVRKGGGRAEANAVSGVSRGAAGAVFVATDLSTIESRVTFADTEQTPLSPSAGSVPVQPALAKRTVIAVHPVEATVCFGEQAVPEVTCIAPDGSRTSMRWTARAAPITEAEIVAWRDSTADLWSAKMGTDEARRLLSEVVHAETRPTYGYLVLDHRGNVWVEQIPPDRDPSGPVQFLVFAPSGTLLGSVELPSLRVLEIGDDYVLGVQRDEMGVEYIRQYRLIKPTG